MVGSPAPPRCAPPQSGDMEVDRLPIVDRRHVHPNRSDPSLLLQHPRRFHAEAQEVQPGCVPRRIVSHARLPIGPLPVPSGAQQHDTARRNPAVRGRRRTRTPRCRATAKRADVSSVSFTPRFGRRRPAECPVGSLRATRRSTFPSLRGHNGSPRDTPARMVPPVSGLTHRAPFPAHRIRCTSLVAEQPGSSIELDRLASAAGGRHLLAWQAGR